MSRTHTKQSKQSCEYWSYPVLSKALEIALYYGFSPADPVHVEKTDRDHAKSFQSTEIQFIRPEEKAALLRMYTGKNAAQLPVYLVTHNKEKQRSQCTLDVLGTTRSIADATLLKTAYEIVRSQGYENVVIELNSIGDRESFGRYGRELGNYYRKHMHELEASCRQSLKKDIYAPLSCSHKECETVKERTPYPMNYLSEPSRIYFMELLELLEISGIPYTLNNTLLANRECAMHTIFKITGSRENSENETVAYGCRWGLIAKKMGLKKDIQGMSATLLVEQPGKQNRTLKFQKPKCYFIQMGQEAKLKSLRVIETLRQSKIPVYHSLTKDKLTAQLSSAENLKVPYILIMGQKESLDNTILIREMSKRSQEIVKIEEVGIYLKKIIG